MSNPSNPLTPAKRLGLGRSRPSLGNLHVSREVSASPMPALTPMASRDAMLARKPSYGQLTQSSLANVPDSSAGYGIRAASRASGDVEVGDLVNTPGGLYGTVKFIGNVRGKAGVFVGVELEGELAGKGKNDGAVDGVRYFTTTQQMSGIFVPLGRTSKRHSIDSSNPPPTPTIPSLPSPTGPTSFTPPSLTPGRRSESPTNRQYGARTPSGRPSLPRPESPIRRGATPRPGLVPQMTPRGVSAAGSRIGALSPTPGVSKLSFGARARTGSVNDGRPGTAGGGGGGGGGGGVGGAPRVAQTPRTPFNASLKQPKSTAGLRVGSAMGMRPPSALERHDEQERSSPTESSIGIAKSDDEAQLLRQQLADRDRQLKEQATSLAEMEASLTELQGIVNSASPGSMMSPRSNSFEDADTAQLRALLREKNEKIQHLTAEFDAHRADFRSTIDTLELASSETERVYEKRIDDLMQEVRELNARNEDVESVARQLKQLEELVAELEEGLEDARRGEAEARGEVEFLRGEVERSREELRREREKSAAAVANAAVGKMMRNGDDDKKDDEIRGLKAIIHSLSRDSVNTGDMNGAQRSISFPNGSKGEAELVKERLNSEKLQTAIKDLEEEINNRASREEQLEKEISELKKKREARTSGSSERTVTPWGNRTSGERRDSKSTVGSWRNRQAGRPPSTSISSLKQLDTSAGAPAAAVIDPNGDPELTPIESDGDSTVPWCEICETAGHDILTCTNMFGAGAGGPASAGPQGSTTATAAAEAESAASGSKQTSPVAEQLSPNGTSKSASDLLAEKKKSVHLPEPPPMIDGSFGPIAGKESGRIDLEKWCAVCERDGHDSVDCPLENEFE